MASSSLARETSEFVHAIKIAFGPRCSICLSSDRPIRIDSALRGAPNSGQAFAEHCI
jgi:hypothetical protein